MKTVNFITSCFFEVNVCYPFYLSLTSYISSSFKMFWFKFSVLVSPIPCLLHAPSIYPPAFHYQNNVCWRIHIKMRQQNCMLTNIKIICIYTGCLRRKGPNFGRVFLRSNYTDITQNTYIQSSMLTEILARKKCGCLLCLRTLLCPWRYTSHMHLTFNARILQ